MVNPQVRPVLALALEQLEEAKSFFVHRLLWHIATLFFLILAAVAVSLFPEKMGPRIAFRVECIAMFIAVATELMALWSHHLALDAHSLGRQIMRRVMLIDAMAPDEAAGYLEFIKRYVEGKVWERARRRLARDEDRGAEQHQLERYYYSERPPEFERLREHLLESAIFSQQLYHSAWVISGCMLSGFVLAMLIVVALIAYRGAITSHDWVELSIRIAAALIAFIPACQELDHALLYRMMSERLKDLIERVKTLWDSQIPREQFKLRLIVDFGDYGAATTFAPSIRTLVYWWHDQRLSQEVVEQMKKLNKQEGPETSS